MAPTPHVVAVCGSLRDESFTRIALRHALDEAELAGATTELVDPRGLDIPIFDADNREPGDVPELMATLQQADAIILGTPMYHGSYSSPLKTILDYAGFDEFDDKTVGLLAVSGGRFPTTALEHLRSVGRSLGAWVLPHQAAIPGVRNQFYDEEFVDEDMEKRVRTLGRRVVQFWNIEADPDTVESEENVGASD
ncbi:MULTISPECIES: NADPH-dependent FMN reductase [unclassified Haladaptatus]|uniref:NADPH-dependent FMN reductase n=1 Tax=unclassified Haladaptatus TaxID=2622732 RepID=UPI0023E770BE|nr:MULTISPECIES: NAD(P)H-dependent oxidoreductase [unclassified Haladaptatus]